MFNPNTGGGGGQDVALKLFELLTYKFVTFPKYEFNTFSKIKDEGGVVKLTPLPPIKTTSDVAGNRVNERLCTSLSGSYHQNAIHCDAIRSEQFENGHFS